MDENDNSPIDACDAPLLELQIQISSIWNDRKRLEAENEHLQLELENRDDYNELIERIKELEALRDTVSISCHPSDDCNDPEVLKTYMKACFDEAAKLY